MAATASGSRRPVAGETQRRDGVRVALAVSRAQRGDREALRWLYLRYKDGVYRYVARIVLDEHEAEDVTQQVFAKLLLVIGRYEPRAEASFSAWLLRLARNAAIDQLRRRRPTLPADAADRVPAGEVDSREDLNAALGTLPPDQRNVVILRHVVGLSPGEIANRLGRTESSVHGLHNRGRRALRNELERIGMVPSCRSIAAGSR